MEKNKNTKDMYQGIRVIRKGFSQNNILRDENGNVVADPKSIVNRWTKYFSQLLYVHEVEMLVPETGISEVEIVFEKLKMYTASGTDEILAELIKRGGMSLLACFV